MIKYTFFCSASTSVHAVFKVHTWSTAQYSLVHPLSQSSLCLSLYFYISASFSEHQESPPILLHCYCPCCIDIFLFVFHYSHQFLFITINNELKCFHTVPINHQFLTTQKLVRCFFSFLFLFLMSSLSSDGRRKMPVRVICLCTFSF